MIIWWCCTNMILLCQINICTIWYIYIYICPATFSSSRQSDAAAAVFPQCLLLHFNLTLKHLSSFQWGTHWHTSGQWLHTCFWQAAARERERESTSLTWRQRCVYLIAKDMLNADTWTAVILSSSSIPSTPSPVSPTTHAQSRCVCSSITS